jgi:hypothetical protein
MHDPIMAAIERHLAAGTIKVERFVFSAVWNTLAASASGSPASITIDPTIDFLAQQMNLTAYTAAGTILANPDYLLEVKSGKDSWSDGPVHVANWTGQARNSGSRPYDFSPGWLMRGNTVTQLKLTNNTATAARVDLALPGLRIMYEGITREQLFRR